MAKPIHFIQKMIQGQVPPAPVMGLIGFRIRSIEPGRAIVEFEATGRHANPMGTLHGGILADIADGAMGFAMASTLDENESFTTAELHIHYLKTIRTGPLQAEARVTKRGTTLSLVECDITDPQGQLIARASSTTLLLRGERARELQPAAR